jgi:hypothetical protein
MKVKLQRSTRGKGSLTLYFTNDDQLQRLYELLVGANGDGSLEALTGNGSDNGYAALLGSVYVVEDSGSDN